MRVLPLLLLSALSAALVAVQRGAPLQFDPPLACEPCEEWNRAIEPFRVFGNTYYVGVAGLSSVLVTSNGGHVLLDGGLPQSAPHIEANIRALGFRLADVRLILNSHAHYDHAGGIAALQRISGARVAAGAAGVRVLQRGTPYTDDPQYELIRNGLAFPPVPRVRGVEDGEILRVGDLAITAHLTPGHTPGSTSWTWKSCEGARCLDVVYADSLNAVSGPGYRFTGNDTQPGIVEDFGRSIAKVGALPCDILLTVHPGFVDLEKKAARRAAHSSVNPFVDPQACRVYASDAGRRLDARVKEERGPSPSKQ